MNQRELFLKHIAQTSPSPLAFEIKKAEGCLLYDTNGKEYIDLIGGISVANIGHRHPKVVEAIKKQLLPNCGNLFSTGSITGMIRFLAFIL